MLQMSESRKQLRRQSVKQSSSLSLKGYINLLNLYNRYSLTLETSSVLSIQFKTFCLNLLQNHTTLMVFMTLQFFAFIRKLMHHSFIKSTYGDNNKSSNNLKQKFVKKLLLKHISKICAFKFQWCKKYDARKARPEPSRTFVFLQTTCNISWQAFRLPMVKRSLRSVNVVAYSSYNLCSFRLDFSVFILSTFVVLLTQFNRQFQF